MLRAVALGAVRTVHTVVFLFELLAIGWLVISGLLGRRDRTVAVAAGAVALESGVFLANSGVCPLTPLARRLGDRTGSVSDIFLPGRVARTIPIWSTALIGLAVALHARGAWRDRCRQVAVSLPRHESEATLRAPGDAVRLDRRDRRDARL